MIPEEHGWDAQSRSLLDDFVTLGRVEKIFERYCAEGKRPTKEEAKAWLESLGWQPHPLANLLRKWGYEEDETMKAKTANWQPCDATKAPQDGWHTPRRRDNQIVLVSYASGDGGVIFRRTWDQDDGSRKYASRLLADDEEFEPWNVEPD